MKTKLSTKTLNLYNKRIELRKWISWDEYITLKVGDKLIMPEYFQDTDKRIGTREVTIEKLWRNISKDNWDAGLEHGCLCGGTKTTYNDGSKTSYGSIGGTFAVNLDDCEENETIESVKDKIILRALSYVSGTDIDLYQFEKYLRNL